MTQREAVNPHPHHFGANSETNDGIRPPEVIAPMDGTAQDSEITLRDLLSSSSLEAATIKNYVASLARGLASLHAEPLVAVTQTLSGGKSFDRNDWLALATQAKGLGATLAITDDTGKPLVLFDGMGDAYVWAQDFSGTPNWAGVNFGEAQQFMSLGKEDMSAVEAKANLMQGIAVAAVKPVPGFSGFLTPAQTYTSKIKLVMNVDGSMSFKLGEKLIGVKTALPETQFGLVIGQVVPGKNGYQF